MNSGGNVAGIRRIARVDLSALRKNLEHLLAQDNDFVLDARANAYGHGLESVIHTAVAAGVTTVLVSRHEHGGAGLGVSVDLDSRRRLVGPAAYGFDSVATPTTAPTTTLALTPVMTLSGEVIAVKQASAGVGVSYGYTYRTTQPTTLALVALGYADGIPRLASNRARVHAAGSLRPLVGLVAMDQFVLDCDGAAPAIGDEVVVFGNPEQGFPSATEWATHTQRTTIELTAGLGSRIERIFT